MDKISALRISLLHPKLRDEALTILAEVENKLTGRAFMRITFGLRTFTEQADLFNLGRTKVNPDGKTAKKPMGNIVTNAKAGQSNHNYGLAVDFALIVDGKTAVWDTKTDFDNDLIPDWMEVVAVFKKYGWSWGGDWKNFKDYPHFEKTFGYSVSQLLQKHNNKQFIKGTTYVEI